ncbi:uncharacterized protein LOC100368297 [Saccoglossus kowalevskii]|uniref:Uncharacterized protein LOC100368297 n=1 Tax=Saccoglossus kowalevskii TaxID=10224 RepID=A0ABM0GWI4_SACKO|nr:PREDICTED: uncharacterized protein LOC100368297 [Saccoglossus kowalevskii]
MRLICVALLITVCAEYVLSDCSHPGEIDGGISNPNSTDAPNIGNWQTVQYECDTGYSMVGSNFLMCANNAWTANAPQCKADCNEPTGLVNGYFQPASGSTFPVPGNGGVINVYCDEGYSLSGLTEATCSGGEFTPSSFNPGTNPKCREKCTLPSLSSLFAETTYDGDTPTNGYLNPGTVANFACIEGYGVSGPRQATCQDGQWNNLPPQVSCIENCNDLTAPLNGYVQGDNYHGAVATFSCKSGFTLIGASTVTCSTSSWSADVPVCQDSLSANILVFLPFENTFEDMSGNEDTRVSEIGKVTFSENGGVSSTAAFFSGFDRIDVYSDRLYAYDTFSVSAWFKRTGNWDMDQGLMSHGGYGDIDGLEVTLSDGQILAAGIANKAKKRKWDYVNVFAESDKWHNIIATYDGAQFKLYVDGVLQDGDVQCCSGMLYPGPLPLRIGQAGIPIDKQYFNGLIDELYVFDIALTASQAYDMYTRDKPTCDDDDLLVHYNFDNGFDDASCNGWDAVPYGVFTSDGAAIFSGKGQVNIEEFINFEWGSAMTVSFWLYCEGCLDVNETMEFPYNRMGLFGNGEYSGDTWEISVDNSQYPSSLVGGWIWSGSQKPPTQLTGASINNYEWYHIAMVYDGDNGQSTLYVNGASVSGATVTTKKITMKSDPVVIGVSDTGDSRYNGHFVGKLDEVKLYSKVLSETEIGNQAAVTPETPE